MCTVGKDKDTVKEELLAFLYAHLLTHNDHEIVQ